MLVNHLFCNGETHDVYTAFAGARGSEAVLEGVTDNLAQATRYLAERRKPTVALTMDDLLVDYNWVESPTISDVFERIIGYRKCEGWSIEVVARNRWIVSDNRNNEIVIIRGDDGRLTVEPVWCFPNEIALDVLDMGEVCGCPGYIKTYLGREVEIVFEWVAGVKMYISNIMSSL